MWQADVSERYLNLFELDNKSELTICFGYMNLDINRANFVLNIGNTSSIKITLLYFILWYKNSV